MARERIATPERVQAWRARVQAGERVADIARDVGLSHQTIWSYTRDVIPPQVGAHRRSDVTVEDVVSHITLGISQRQTSMMLGCSLNTVRQRLWEAGLGPDPKHRGRGDYGEYVRTVRKAALGAAGGAGSEASEAHVSSVGAKGSGPSRDRTASR
ncbi:hypothetical protein BJD55_gp044 [Gordonia phage Yvonnetastic]|uniref:Uncharacterized protein n=1 Tax=Gordonia phage Yvonnetastic TaxID=1821566 RepID=A0A142K9D9_9CAUD|nr:hypothetical protein BJD55_gp044 [Gordonia phage Yvonnetastic]AMS02722.1 hypothetical protein SEA_YVONNETASTIC_178 [Gordonia phage Yvonnetastic]